jgi:non-ribosomal peptide synthetase component F
VWPAGFETVFDPGGDGGALARDTELDTVLRVDVSRRGGGLVLRLRYRAGVVDAGAAARIAGYHRTALALIAADADAEEAVAAVHGQTRWTYRELNARANRLARALRARGLRREGVVAVVTERTLDWLAAVLAIFKAGGVYLPIERGDLVQHFGGNPAAVFAIGMLAGFCGTLCTPMAANFNLVPAAPIEPRFPAERIATTLARAECGLVLAEPGSTATLEKALDTLTVSTRACSTTSMPRSATWTSARATWSPRPHPSASTSRCGN